MRKHFVTAALGLLVCGICLAQVSQSAKWSYTPMPNDPQHPSNPYSGVWQSGDYGRGNIVVFEYKDGKLAEFFVVDKGIQPPYTIINRVFVDENGKETKWSGYTVNCNNKYGSCMLVTGAVPPTYLLGGPE